MKSIDRLITLMMFVALLLAVLVLGSCQEEGDELIDPVNGETIAAGSNVAGLIERTALRDGSGDNILDGSSCTSIVLPVTVIANGLEVIVDSEDDFVTLERIFDELDDDEDILEFIFPVTVTLADHTEIVINDEDALEELIDECIEGGSDNDIECLDFVYPLTVNIFDTNSQVGETLTINDDKELYDLIDDLDEDDRLSFSFPITVVRYDGEQLQINSNDELERIIEDARDDCDEDDDNDFDEDDVDDTPLVNVLTDGEWEITLFFDEVDETTDFNGFIFTFNSDKTAIARRGDLEIQGSWSTSGDDGTLELDLDFGDGNPLEELDEDWELIEFDGTIIRLTEEEEDGTDEFLTFERPSGNNPGEPNELLTGVITEGTWQVASYNDNGEDKTSDYTGFSLAFSEDGAVLATNGSDEVQGTWSEVTDDGRQELVMDFGVAEPFDEFNDDWEIVEVSETRIELRDDDSNETLVFERQ